MCLKQEKLVNIGKYGCLNVIMEIPASIIQHVAIRMQLPAHKSDVISKETDIKVPYGFEVVGIMVNKTFIYDDQVMADSG